MTEIRASSDTNVYDRVEIDAPNMPGYGTRLKTKKGLQESYVVLNVDQLTELREAIDARIQKLTEKTGEAKVPLSGVDMIAAERQSAIDKGFDSNNDRVHNQGELLMAAEAHVAISRGVDEPHCRNVLWPWKPSTFHVNTKLSSLAKAGGLIASEIDRRIEAGELE